MGGPVPIGYDVVARKLVINEAESRTVCHIFERYAALGSGREVIKELRADGYRTKLRESGGRTTAGIFSNAARSSTCSQTRSTSARWSTRAPSMKANTTGSYQQNSGRSCSSGLLTIASYARETATVRMRACWQGCCAMGTAGA